MIILEVMFKSLAIVALLILLSAVVIATVQSCQTPKNRRIDDGRKKRS